MTRRRLWIEWLLIGICASLVLIVAEKAKMLERSDRLIYDIVAPLYAAPASPDIVVVGIDHQSLSAFGRWPWPRDIHAKALSRMEAADPAAILYNVMFVEPTDGDVALATAIKGPAPVYLPILFDPPGRNGASFSLLPPEALFTRAAAGLGTVNLEMDNDGRARGVMMATRAGHNWLPNIAELAYRHLRGTPSPAYRQAVATGKPTFVPFRPIGSFPVFSLRNIINGTVRSEQLHGKVIIVGATASGLGDLYAVPGSTELMSGAEVQANLLSSLLVDRFITPVPRNWVIFLSLLPLWTLLASFRRLTPSQSLVASIGIIIAIIMGSGAMLTMTGLWFPPIGALLGVVIVYPLWGWRRLTAVTQFIDQEVDALLSQSGMSRASAPAQRGGDHVDRRTSRLHQIIALMRRNAAEREQMLQFLSHDMRAPQAAIIALLESEGSNHDPDRQKQVQARIRSYAETTLSLADEFVHLSRVEAQEVSREPVDVIDAMAQAIDIIWPHAHSSGIKVLRRWVDGDDLWVMGDAAALVRAFTNLVSNAVQASPPGGAVHCDVQREGGRVLASVRDEGPGLPAERRADPFARFGYSGARSGERSTGLGLAFVEAVARSHGGGALYEDGKTGGACFTIYLPLWVENAGDHGQI